MWALSIENNTIISNFRVFSAWNLVVTAEAENESSAQAISRLITSRYTNWAANETWQLTAAMRYEVVYCVS